MKDPSACSIAKLQGWNSKKRVVTIHIADTQPQNMIAAKYLRGIIKVVEAVGRHIIIRKGHKGQFSFGHQISKMGVGDGQKLKPFGPAAGVGF